MDWSLYRCGREGHLTYAPHEAPLREHLSARTASAELWQCLRCGTFVTGQPSGTGPAADAPAVRRGKEIRGDFILKLFAVERAIRFILFGAVAFGLWKFASARLTLTQAFNKDIKIVRSMFTQLGFNINHSLVHELNKFLHLSPRNLTLAASAVTALAVISGIEAFALWQARRWGEYFAMIVTSLGLPIEVYELTNSVTVTKVILFVLNLLLVFYLVYTRRLFGARGGKHAYEARLRSESVMDAATKAAAARRAAPAAAAETSGPGPAAGQPASAAPGTPAEPTQQLGGSRQSSVTVPYNRPDSSGSQSGPPPPGS